jgi:hypothetical protein
VKTQESNPSSPDITTKAREFQPSIWPAVILSAICLVTFAALRDYGPESALRRFHEAVRDGDDAAITLAVGLDVSQAKLEFARAQVWNLIQQGARYRILKMDRTPTRVGAEVVYTLPNGYSINFYWIMKKERRVWRVDLNESFRG